jgi:hypothetical protein
VAAEVVALEPVNDCETGNGNCEAGREGHQAYYLQRLNAIIRRRLSDRSICQPTGLLDTVCAAINLVLSFDAVTEDAAVAVCTSGRHRLDRALETVKTSCFDHPG